MYTQAFTVGPEHLDSLDHVHYLQFQVFAEETQRGLVDKLGIDIETLRRHNLSLFIREVHVKCRQELHLEDRIEVTMHVKAIKNPLINFTSQIIKGAKVVADISFSMVLFDVISKGPVKIPDWLRRILDENQ